MPDRGLIHASMHNRQPFDWLLDAAMPAELPPVSVEAAVRAGQLDGDDPAVEERRTALLDVVGRLAEQRLPSLHHCRLAGRGVDGGPRPRTGGTRPPSGEEAIE